MISTNKRTLSSLGYLYKDLQRMATTRMCSGLLWLIAIAPETAAAPNTKLILPVVGGCVGGVLLIIMFVCVGLICQKQKEERRNPTIVSARPVNTDQQVTSEGNLNVIEHPVNYYHNPEAMDMSQGNIAHDHGTISQMPLSSTSIIYGSMQSPGNYQATTEPSAPSEGDIMSTTRAYRLPPVDNVNNQTDLTSGDTSSPPTYDEALKMSTT